MYVWWKLDIWFVEKRSYTTYDYCKNDKIVVIPEDIRENNNLEEKNKLILKLRTKTHLFCHYWCLRISFFKVLLQLYIHYRIK